MAEEKQDATFQKFRETVSPNIAFIIERSKNKNVVVYEAQFEAGGARLKADDPLTVYWMDIDPEYQKAARAAGRADDRVELGMIEKKMAYGLTATPAADGEYEVNLVALPERKLTLYVKDGRAFARMQIGGKPTNLVRIYVDSTEGWVRPTVNHVDLYGYDAETNEVRTERIKP